MPRAVRERLILDVAGQVFARSGYHATSMDDIAELADVSKPMLYAYFGSKEGLYLAYIDRNGRELLARLQGAATENDPPAARLRARIAEFFGFVAEHSDGWRVLFGEMTSSRPVFEEVSTLRAQIAQTVREMLEEQAPLRRPASDAVAHAIVGAGESLANWWLKHGDVPGEDVTDWYVDIVQAAVAAAMKRSTAERI